MHRRAVLATAALLTASCAAEPVTTTTTLTATTGTTATTTTLAAGTVTTAPTSTATTLPPLAGLAYEPVAEIDFPVLVTALPGSAETWVATKDGRLWRLEDGAPLSGPALDITDRVRNSGEQGLLGMALHPTNPERVFLHYSAADGDTVVAEFSREGDRIEPASERVLLRLDQPAGNHNGGMLQFGPAGFLYLGLGDGGGANDQFGNGQNADTLLAGIVRIDVDGATAAKVHSGLRNPWRFWIDEPSGLLYIGDVGQGAYEEIDVVAFDGEGRNFGWPITEGLHCFSPRRDCDVTGLTLPVLEIAHGDGGACSVTGGVVYRGAAIPELTGHYLYSDYCGGWLRSFRWDGSAVTDPRDWSDLVGVPGPVVSFGVDGAGEVYVLTVDRVLRLVPVR